MPTELIVSNALEEYIRNEISKSGEWTFAQFMNSALYHPRWGYYNKNVESADYYTNVDVNTIFSEVLASFVAQLWEKNFKGEPFHLIELGCGNGKLCRQILNCLKKCAFYKDLKFIGIERSEIRLESCNKLKEEFGENIEFSSDFNFQKESLSGIIYSNEFFDALPVNRIMKERNQLREVTIDSHFKENFRELSPSLREYFSWLGHEPLEGCLGEAHLSTREWMRKLAQSFKKGLILTIDYGFESEELYSDFRREGTTLCHFRNRTNKEFYERIGEQDITAHVNFSVLEKEAAKWGFQSTLQTQTDFLLNYGLNLMVEGDANKNLSDRENLKRALSIRSLLHPEGMGGTFKVLLQRKSI